MIEKSMFTRHQKAVNPTADTGVALENPFSPKWVWFSRSVCVVTVVALCVCVWEADLGEALLVDMVHHHYFIVITGWRAPRADEGKHTEQERDKQHTRRTSETRFGCFLPEWGNNSPLLLMRVLSGHYANPAIWNSVHSKGCGVLHGVLT